MRTSALSAMKAFMDFRYYGRTSYAVGLELQEEALYLVLQDQKPRVLGFEFEPTITLGRRAQADQDLLECPNEFAVLKVERGGETTLHAPGQLVIYPVVHLPSMGFGVREFVEGLLRVTQRTLQQFGVESECRSGSPGLYTSRGKIAFVGLKVTRGVSTHGLALNVHNDLTCFDRIRSCGVQKASVDSLARHRGTPSLDTCFSMWIKEFASLTRRPADG